MSSSVFETQEFDVESVQFIPGPDITNEELGAIALALFNITNNSFSHQNTAWQIDSLINYDSE